MALLAITFQTQCNQRSQINNEHVHADTVCTLSYIRVASNTHTASWPPTRSGELFNCKHPDYRPVYTERVVRLGRIRTPSGSCQPCAPNCLKLPFTTGSSGSRSDHRRVGCNRRSLTGHNLSLSTLESSPISGRLALAVVFSGSYERSKTNG